MRQVEVGLVDGGAAAEVLAVIREAFGARPPLDPPTDALHETEETVRAELAEYGGLLARLDGRPVGSLIFDGSGPGLMVRRFGVAPAAQGRGVAGAMTHAAEEHARRGGYAGIRLTARVELPDTVRFWQHHGYVRSGREGASLTLAKVFPHRLVLPTAEDAHVFGKRLSGLLRAGDLVILSGDLGAGKTTMTQGIGAGLGVRGDITSPTFVIARVHPSLGDGPDLVHVDAYRLGSIEELDDLDLDTSLDDAVTVVEWGSGVAEGLAEDRLEIRLLRSVGVDASADDHDPREVVVQPVGLRWLASGLGSL